MLACGPGPGAALSHFDAAAHLGLMPTRGAKVHVTRPTTAGRAPDPRRIVLHRTGTLRRDEVADHDGIPTTTTARTLLDLAAHLRPAAIEEIVERAIRLHRFDLVAVPSGRPPASSPSSTATPSTPPAPPSSTTVSGTSG